MSILYLILLIILYILLILILATKPNSSALSQFELERRSSLGDNQAKRDLLRLKFFEAINSIIKLKILWVQTVIICIAILYLGWLVGILITIFISVICLVIASTKIIKKLAKKFYNFTEPNAISFLDKHPNIVRLLDSESWLTKKHTIQIRSREELMKLIAESEGALNQDEKRLVANSLTFKERNITSVMTPRNLIKSVDRTEFLGPLVLDELHKSGHSHLPVINGDLDHIIGILNISSLLSLEDKKSMTAEKAMDKKVYYIRDDHSLYQALSVFLRTQNRLLIVVNEAKETIGVVVLKDVIEALVGRHSNEDDSDL